MISPMVLKSWLNLILSWWNQLFFKILKAVTSACVCHYVLVQIECNCRYRLEYILVSIWVHLLQNSSGLNGVKNSNFPCLVYSYSQKVKSNFEKGQRRSIFFYAACRKRPIILDICQILALLLPLEKYNSKSTSF